MYSIKDTLVKSTTVYIRIGKEIPQLLALLVVVQHSKTLVAEETRVTWCKLVIGSSPPADVDMAYCTLLGVNPVFVDKERIEFLVRAVIPMHQPDIGDDDKMLTVSLVTVEVRKAHFHFQIYKLCVLHLSLGVWWKIPSLCPFNGSYANVLALWEPHVVVENALLTKSGTMSGLSLNSPQTCKSLTQQMASRSSVKVWEPVISRVMWGLL